MNAYDLGKLAQQTINPPPTKVVKKPQTLKPTPAKAVKKPPMPKKPSWPFKAKLSPVTKTIKTINKPKAPWISRMNDWLERKGILPVSDQSRM